MATYTRRGPVVTGVDIELHDAMAWGNPADYVMLVDVGAIERLQPEIDGRGSLLTLRKRSRFSSQEHIHATESVEQIRQWMGRGAQLH